MKFLVTKLDEIPWVYHGFFSKEGNKAEDAADALGLDAEDIAMLKQVHGVRTVVLDAPWGDDMPDADAVVTTQQDIGLAIRTADCAPVLFADREKPVVGAAHAGWRGALDGVLEDTIAKMTAQGAAVSTITAVIGPCIRQESYEVDDSFKKTFTDKDADSAAFFKAGARDGHHQFNLPGYVHHRLKRAGITDVVEVEHDTLAMRDVYFSHRRGTLAGKKEDGRQLSVIAIRDAL
jgi:YfiH family protein